MRQRLWVFLVVFAVILAGCGGQGVQPSTGPTTSSGEVFQIALPRLVVDVDAQGNPSVLGISPALLSAFGVDVAGFQLPPDLVKQMTAAGVQHLEIASIGDRIMFFANAKPLPHLGWTTDSLNRMLDLLSTMKVPNAQTIRTVLPLITRLGLDVVLRFPRDPATAEIPFIDTATVHSFQPTTTTEPPSAVVKFELRFNEQGQAGAMTLSPGDLQALGLGSLLKISPETLANLQSGNIQNAEIRTKPDGGYVYINNEPLPRIIWDSQLLANMTDLFGEIAPNAQFLPVIQQLVPYLDRMDLGILLRFPPAAGQAVIPAQLH